MRLAILAVVKVKITSTRVSWVASIKIEVSQSRPATLPHLIYIGLKTFGRGIKRERLGW